MQVTTSAVASESRALYAEPLCILAFATQGAGGDDEKRLRDLLETLPVEFFSFTRGSRWASFRSLLQELLRDRYSLAVMEGSGIGGGAALLLARWLRGRPYVVSSGDAVGPFLKSRMPWGAPIFYLYERLLCRFAAGFIGWTPMLAGRALTFGCPRAMTATGWAPFTLPSEQRAEARARVRRSLGIDENALVFGLVGSLDWNPRVGYCYGWELVQAAGRAGSRSDICVLVAGDGDGLAELKAAAARLKARVVFPGRIPRAQVPEFLAAMDVASLPQTVDQVGSFRYTTKLSEYLAAGLPVITSRIPLSYDLNTGWLWRLPGATPWGEEFISSLAGLMRTIHVDDLVRKRSALPPHVFDKAAQVDRVTQFIEDLLPKAPACSL
jgi:glycosyltransferase involved in cell wall biosynthesis